MTVTAGGCQGTGEPFIRAGTPAGRWVLLAAILGSGIAILDGSVVNVALPAIGADLGAEMAQLQWVVNAYLLTLASLILVGGGLGDRWGRRRVFLIGIAWFGAASLLCAVAQTADQLVLARLAQGVGGALLTPGSLAIIQASFAPQDRGKVIGQWAGLGGVAAAVGPVLGGWVVEVSTWRWIFLVNVPIAALIVYVGARHVPESLDPDAPHGYDVTGSALGVLGLGGVTFALIEVVLALRGVVRGRRRRRARGVPARGVAQPAPADAAAPVPVPDVQRGQRDDAARLRRARRDDVLPGAAAAGGRRLHAVAGRLRHAADHPVHAVRFLQVGRARRAHRPAAADVAGSGGLRRRRADAGAASGPTRATGSTCCRACPCSRWGSSRSWRR